MPLRAPLGGNPADFVLTARLREPVRFTDLSERRALKLSALPGYLSRAHFDSWHRRLGAPNFDDMTGVFTPLHHVDVEVSDVPLATRALLVVRGHSHLARILDGDGGTRHIAREGVYTVAREDGTPVGRARFVNVFTRYDPDPARRRVIELPSELGLGTAPSRVIEVPRVESLLPTVQQPDFSEQAARVWHYTQTDPNRHVNGMEYLRGMEDFVSCGLAERGRDLRGLFPARARLVYRKPCFRGETYGRAAWLRAEAPLVVAGEFRKGRDGADGPPAVAVELTLARHAA
jgi:hypothetical protein